MSFTGFEVKLRIIKSSSRKGSQQPFEGLKKRQIPKFNETS